MQRAGTVSVTATGFVFGQVSMGRQRQGLSAHLCAGGCGVADHGLQHVGGHNDRLTAFPAPLHDAALPVRHLCIPTNTTPSLLVIFETC